MNEKRKFKCKVEELPAIAGYLAQRLRADLVDFASFSDVFSEDYVTQLVGKTTECNQVIVSDVLTKEIKELTKQIAEKTRLLRLGINKVEVYLNMADGEMTVAADMLGVKQLRADINNGNSEGVAAQARRLITGIKANLTVLQAKGLKPALLTEITQLTDEIEKLGNDQNFKTTERNRHTDENNELFNELWDMLSFILETGRALYRGVNDTKLNDYTLTSILKRLNAEGVSPKVEAAKA